MKRVVTGGLAFSGRCFPRGGFDDGDSVGFGVGGACALTFRLEDASLGEEAVAELFHTVFEVQGCSALGEGFSSGDVETVFEVADGKVRVKLLPKGENPPAPSFPASA